MTLFMNMRCNQFLYLLNTGRGIDFSRLNFLYDMLNTFRQGLL